MEIPQSLDINRLVGSSQGLAPNELGREAFLELLITQLTNQNPLSPLQDHEFVAQLATFSSLEQLENINEGMQASVLMSQSVNNSLATTLIGKEVLAEGRTIHLGPSEPPSFLVELAEDANVTVLIRDEAGNLVKRLDQGRLAPGLNAIDWDGTTEAGGRAEEGDYTVEILATDEAGVSVASLVKVRARVTGVRFIDGTGYLMLGELAIPLASVVEVLEPSGS